MRKRTRRAKAPLSKWQSSSAFRAMASAAMTDWNEKRRQLPKCGARRKHDGEPCQQVAMANGRCVYHGGKTPKGDQWHRYQWPERDGPRVMKKLQQKLAQIERQEKARAARNAAMSDEARAAHEEWKKARPPGSAAARTLKRRDKQTATEIRELLARPEPTPSPEVAQIAAEIAKLQQQLQKLKGTSNVEKSE